MLIAIDARLANEAKRAGVGNYCFEVLRALPHALPGARLRLYLDRPPATGFPVGPEEADIRVLPSAAGWTHRVLSRALRRDPPEVFWSPVMQIPWRCPCPSVATVHDLAFLSFPEHFTWKKRAFARVQARQAVRSAARFIADSEATRRDLVARYGVEAERVDVALLGCSAQFYPCTPEKIAALREQLGLPERYVLYVGRIQPRKNIPRLIEAFGEMLLRRPDLPHHLVIAGDEGWMIHSAIATAKASDASGRIHLPGFIEEAGLPVLMSGADALVLISLWEGFGLPVLEAMACGTPVITSDRSSLPEVAGEAALLVDPYDTAALGQALEKVCTDEALRADLAVKGRRQAKRFTWDATATAIAAALRRAAEE